MKKRVFIVLLVLLFVFGTAKTLAYHSSIIIDGTRLESLSHGERLPLNDIIKHSHGTVMWSGYGKYFVIHHDSNTVVIIIGSWQAIINGRYVNINVAPKIIGDNVMVSPCFLSDNLGFGIGHINSTFIVSTTPAQQIPVLIYHHILPDEVNTHFKENAWTISTTNFAEQMRYLRNNNFYTPTLEELKNFLYRGRPLPSNSIMIHFDDGYYSNFVYAYPILEEYGFRAVLFPITRESEKLGEVQPPLDYTSLTHAAASTLRRQSSIFETASHSHALHDRNEYGQTLLIAASKEDIIADTMRSFEFVSNNRAYAYPLGMFNETVINALVEAGIKIAFTVNRGYVDANSDPFRLPRFTIYQTTNIGRFSDIVSGRM